MCLPLGWCLDHISYSKTTPRQSTSTTVYVCSSTGFQCHCDDNVGIVCLVAVFLVTGFLIHVHPHAHKCIHLHAEETLYSRPCRAKMNFLWIWHTPEKSIKIPAQSERLNNSASTENEASNSWKIKPLSLVSNAVGVSAECTKTTPARLSDTTRVVTDKSF